MSTISANHKYHGLDVLRGLLALLVVFAHAIQVFIGPLEQEATSFQFTMGLLARLAVIWFFCLSGYVITMSVCRNIERNGKFALAEYARSRFWRVAPALLFVLIFVIVLAKIAAFLGFSTLPEGVRGARSEFAVQLKSQVLSLLSIGAIGELPGRFNGPLWSLQYELQLYVLVGLGTFVMIPRASTWKRLTAVVGLLIYLKYAFHLRSLSGEMSHQILWYATFFAGVLGYLACRQTKTVWLWWCALIGIGVGAAIIVRFTMEEFEELASTSPALMLAQFSISIGFTALIIMVSRLPVSRRSASMGDFAYTLYIVHFPILLFLYFYLVRHVEYSREIAWWCVGIGIAVAVLISKWLSTIIENPALLQNIAGRLTVSIRQMARAPMSD